MNRILHKSLVLIFSLITLSGCYNNSHIRTQRIIKPEEKVISAHVGLNIISPNALEAPDRIQASGVSGARAGLSFLSLKKGYEQGFSFGLGILDNRTDVILGYDIRKVKYNSTGVPYRRGLYVELNHIINKQSSAGIQAGDVIQLRPYFMTTTSENRSLYGGFHGLLSLGTISRKDYDYYERAGNHLEYKFNVSSIGAGVTGGSEFRLGSLLFQTQADLSLVNQKHQSFEEIFVTNDWIEDSFNSFGPVVSIGMAIHRAPPRVTLRASSPGVLPQKRTSKTSYDPFTGQAVPITQPSIVRYDPLTGAAVVDVPKSAFDPNTGLVRQPEAPQPDEKLSPYSLLSDQEKTKLLLKGLSVSALNGISVNAKVLDVLDQGLLIERDNYGNSTQEILYYTRINNIRFQGPNKGWSGGVNGALKGCGLGAGIPFVLTILSGESGFMFLSVLAVPPAVLGGMIFGFSSKDHYNLRILKGPASQTDLEYRQKRFQEVISLYLEDSFPKGDLDVPATLGKP